MGSCGSKEVEAPVAAKKEKPGKRAATGGASEVIRADITRESVTAVLGDLKATKEQIDFYTHWHTLVCARYSWIFCVRAILRARFCARATRGERPAKNQKIAQKYIYRYPIKKIF